MTWSFIVVVVALVLAPGADFAVIVRNTLSGGRGQGAITTAGVSSAAAIQGLLVTIGLAGVIVRIHPLFLALQWGGVVYLAWLAFGMLRSAVRGDYPKVGMGRRLSAPAAFRQGFLCNASNPKILVFYLSLLSQFVAPGAPWTTWLMHAWMVPFLGTVWCLTIVRVVGSVRSWLQRRPVRRALDAASGLVLAGSAYASPPRCKAAALVRPTQFARQVGLLPPDGSGADKALKNVFNAKTRAVMAARSRFGRSTAAASSVD